MGELIRTFIAIEIPDGIKAAMADVQGTLRKTGADVGWTRPEGVHLTLKFLGPVEAQTDTKARCRAGNRNKGRSASCN